MRSFCWSIGPVETATTSAFSLERATGKAASLGHRPSSQSEHEGIASCRKAIRCSNAAATTASFLRCQAATCSRTVRSSTARSSTPLRPAWRFAGHCQEIWASASSPTYKNSEELKAWWCGAPPTGSPSSCRFLRAGCKSLRTELASSRGDERRGRRSGAVPNASISVDERATLRLTDGREFAAGLDRPVDRGRRARGRRRAPGWRGRDGRRAPRSRFPSFRRRRCSHFRRGRRRRDF